MSNNIVINEKKKALLAYKEKILEEIKYYERSIDDFRTNHKNNSFYDNHADSSDSEDEFPLAVDTGPTIPQLKLQQALMKTCLQATQELTSLTVLQSEINVLVEEPTFEGERPVSEAGTWREVTAECRIDLVPFTITFFMHTPTRKFAPPSYRGLRVVPVKSTHEMELAKSVLHNLKLPSDAVEVLRSYAVAYRSRRTTLARLANKYANALFMEPHPEGGFVLKCADLLEVSWRLENKWSPVAPFHHKMKFDLEYMDETYIKIITQAHKQLLDPAIQTDERTLLLAKIITTCLEVRGPMDPESDLESKTTDNNDIDKRDSENEKRDSEVMAPPKSLPKKGKQKNKNSLPNSAQKRAIDDENGDNSAKKMRNSDIPSVASKKSITEANNVARKSKINDIVNEGSKKRKINDDKMVDSGNTFDSNTKTNDGDGNTKNIKEAVNTAGKGDTAKSNKEKNLEDKTNTVKEKTKKNVKDSDIAVKITKSSKETVNTVDKQTNSNTKPKTKTVKATEMKENDNGNTKPKENTTNAPGNTEQDKVNAKSKNKLVKSSGVTEKADGNTKSKENNVRDTGNTVKDKINAKSKTKTVKGTENEAGNTKLKEITKDTGNTGQNKIKMTKEPSNTEINKNTNKNPKNMTTKVTNNENNNPNDNNTKTKNSKDNIDPNERPKNKITDKKTKIIAKTVIDSTKTKENKVISTKNDEKSLKKGSEDNKTTKNLNSNIVKKVTEKNATNNRIKDKISQISKVSDKLSTNVVTKNNKINTIKNIPHHRNALKAQNPQKSVKAGNTKLIATSNTEKENGGKISKIPQKKLSSISEGSSKQNLLRVSPRKIPSKFETATQESFKQKMIKTTNIPRLLKKPAPKSTQ